MAGQAGDYMGKYHEQRVPRCYLHASVRGTGRGRGRAVKRKRTHKRAYARARARYRRGAHFVPVEPVEQPMPDRRISRPPPPPSALRPPLTAV